MQIRPTSGAQPSRLQSIDAFLRALAPDDAVHTFQTFHDREKDTPGPIIHATIADALPRLDALQQQGHGVFWTVNRTRGEGYFVGEKWHAGRELEDITAVRCVWLDIDRPGADIAPILAALPPHAVVESSAGKRHIYWRVSDLSLELFSVALDMLTARWQGDVGAKGINRVLRLPGFWHLKGDPFHVTPILLDAERPPYQVAHIQYYLLGNAPLVAATPAERTGALSSAPRADWIGPEDDATLLQRAMRSSSGNTVFGKKASFADLWEANPERLAECYPPENDRSPYNASQADAALAQHLAFWTGCHGERIERLMLESGLARDKWTQRETYLRDTIGKACAMQGDVLTAREVEPLPSPPTTQYSMPEAREITGGRMSGAAEQKKLFAGCVIVIGLNSVLVPGGVILKPEQFRTFAGGYSFVMDEENGRISRDAWECLTQSQLVVFPRADGVCFRPERAEGELIVEPGRTLVNIYSPVKVARKVGDASLFLDHMRKLFPDDTDRAIVLQYAAACVQRAGTKFQWAPLIQGVPGNGKTLLSRCVAEAVGKRYVHWPKASKLGNQFNGWMSGKVFYGVEDIYIPGSKAEILEELKPMITGGDGLEIERKGIDQTSEDICGNFIFNTNHKGAVPKTDDDRRFAVLHTPQQEVSHLIRDGMTKAYFSRLYNWLKREDGYAIVAELLHTLPLSQDFLDTLESRAPITSSTSEAIAASYGGAEQEILERIEMESVGFAGDWVSSLKLDELLKEIRAERAIPRNRRAAMMGTLGYVYHPAFKNGLVTQTILPDNGRPRLYVRKASAAYHLTDPADVIAAYTEAQKDALTKA